MFDLHGHVFIKPTEFIGALACGGCKSFVDKVYLNCGHMIIDSIAIDT